MIVTTPETKSPGTVLVLCHSILNNMFRCYRGYGAVAYQKRQEARFIGNFIIEMSSELPERTYFAFTTKKIFDDLGKKLLEENAGPKTYEYIHILRTLIYCVSSEQINKLDEDEGVFVIADTLYSRSSYDPLLVTDIPKKREKALSFYGKGLEKKEDVSIPFPIANVETTKTILKSLYPEVYDQTEKRMKRNI